MFRKKEKYIIILLSQKFERVNQIFEKKAVRVFPGISFAQAELEASELEER